MSHPLKRIFEDAEKSNGGPEAVLRILKAFYAKMAADTMIGFFFAGKDTDAIATMQHQFLLKAAGLAKEYRGRGPSQAHLSLPPILPGHFDRRLRLLEETLREQGLSEESVRAWVAFESTFREVVVARN